MSRLPQSEQGSPTLGNMLLKECPLNKAVRLVSFSCEPQHELRVKELGLRVGNELTVTQHAGFGGVVINVGGSRVAVDYASAKRIHVAPAEEDEAWESALPERRSA